MVSGPADAESAGLVTAAAAGLALTLAAAVSGPAWASPGPLVGRGMHGTAQVVIHRQLQSAVQPHQDYRNEEKDTQTHENDTHAWTSQKRVSE